MTQSAQTYTRQVHRANEASLTLQRWVALIGGCTLAALGISRRKPTGIALVIAGSLLAYRGVSATRKPGVFRSVASFAINCTPEEAYRFWRKFENLPLFMRHLESVRTHDARRSEWIARGPLGRTIRWDAEILDEQENVRIAWRSLPGSDIQNNGTVEFRTAPGGRGTILTAVFQYDPPAGPIGKAFAKMLGKDPEFAIREDMRRFKALIEAREIPTTEGQTHGRRSAAIKAFHAAYPEKRKATEFGARELVGAERRAS